MWSMRPHAQRGQVRTAPPKEGSTMNATSTRRLVVAATALASLLVPVAAGTAAAKPEGAGGPAATHVDSGHNCKLQRIERQLVRCDHLTGAGVAAPLSVPEL
jgi:hypothetical protein